MGDEDVRLTDINHPLNTLDFAPTLYYIPQNATLLDVGCGKGTYLSWLKEHRPDIVSEGIDRNKDYVQFCKVRGLNVKVGDAQDLEYAHDSFDIVTSFHVLEHLEWDKETLWDMILIAKTRVILILPKTIVRLDQLAGIDQWHYTPYYTPLGLNRLLKNVKAFVENHYCPTGVFESWKVIIEASGGKCRDG